MSQASDVETSQAHLAKSNALQNAQDITRRLLQELFQIVIAVRRSAAESRLRRADHSFDEHRYGELRDYLTIIIKAGSLPQFDKEHGFITYNTVQERPLDEIQARLVTANLRRRHRFLYAQKHSLKMKPYHVTALRHIVPPETSHSGVDDPEQLPHTTAIGSSLPERILTELTSTEASTPEGPIVMASKSAASSTVVSSTSVTVKYPNPPKIAEGQAYVKCPCCCIPLSSSDLKGRKWRCVRLKLMLPDCTTLY